MFSMLRQAGPQVAPIDPALAVQKAAAGEVIVIDVRDISEVKASGKAEGALHIPLTVFQMQVDPKSPECLEALSTDKPMVLYCASGARSNMAAQMMLQMGYTEVYNLGGLQHWQMAGGRIKK